MSKYERVKLFLGELMSPFGWFIVSLNLTLTAMYTYLAVSNPQKRPFYIIMAVTWFFIAGLNTFTHTTITRARRKWQ